MSADPIATDDLHPRRRVGVLDAEIEYVDTGSGDPIVFLHGNPTSSYLWRNVLPHVAGLGRCLAPDLVGMGRSSPAPSGPLRFVEHARYLDAWFDALGLERNVVLVLHDWGSVLGFHRAHRYPRQVQGIAYMESLVQPRRWDDFPSARAELFRALRSPAGERLAVEENFFVETVLQRSVLRALSDVEMAAYRTPTASATARLQTLTWARELPIDGTPADVDAIVADYADGMARSTMPKLFVNAEPGALLTGRARDFCRTWPNQREVTVPGIHYLQEDSPAEIGAAIAAFVRELRTRATAEGVVAHAGDGGAPA